MKGLKLISEVVLLLFVLGLVAFFIEKKYSRFQTDADRIFQNYELYKNDSIVVVLGSSHALMLDKYYPDTNKYVVNFSIGGQDLFREYVVLRKVFQDKVKVQRVLLALDYDAVGYNQVLSGEGYIDKQYFKYVDTLYDDGFTNRLMGASSFFRSNRNVSYLFSASETPVKPIKMKRSKITMPYIPVRNDELSAEGCRLRAIEHSSIKFKKTLVNENITYLKSIMELCAQNKVELIVLTTPKMQCYCDNSNKSNIDFAKKNTLKLIHQYKIQHYDFYGDTSFSADDFIDYDHLNDNGVKKLYQKLNAIFVKK